jgi:hypothetical protein
MTQRQPPRFYGVATYADPLGRFSFRYPTTWHQFELDDQREGVMFSPEAENPQTWFSVWVSQLDANVVAEDLEDLKVGVEEGLSQLPECIVEQRSEEPLGNLIKFERIFTFREDGVTRKRRLWILYVDTWQMVVTYQGASEEEYDYWLSMGNYSFFHFTIPEALWFATDRDLSGYTRD